MKNFFMYDLRSNISNDVKVFLDKELSTLKSPVEWKAELFDKLTKEATEDTQEKLLNAINWLKAAEINRYNTLCGRAIACLLLNHSNSQSNIYMEMLTEEALIEALEKAAEVVRYSELYDESNFGVGMLNNAKEFIWSLLITKPKQVADGQTPKKMSSETKAPEELKNPEETKVPEDKACDISKLVLKIPLNIILKF